MGYFSLLAKFIEAKTKIVPKSLSHDIHYATQHGTKLEIIQAWANRTSDVRD